MDKNEALNNALSMIEKQFWKGSIMKLWDKEGGMDIETFSSGSLWLDLALGWWYAKGRIVEIYGPESSGKTTLTLHAIAEIQKAGWTAAFIDAEHALDPKYAKKIGVDTDNLIISQPDYGEQALEITEALVRSGAVDLIIVDSVAALTPKAEIEGDMWDSHMGLQARLMSQALRKITWAISRTWTTVIFINQIRMKISVMFGSPETTTWGNALKFYASQRLDIRRKSKIEQWTGNDKEILGSLTKVKVIKNKVAPPFREAEFDIMYNEWISKVWELLDIWAKSEVVKKAGAFYSYQDTRLWQGREKSKVFLKENPEIANEIEEVIKNSLDD
jgi:recombination protein RecA